jgi:hypothetical protein
MSVLRLATGLTVLAVTMVLLVSTVQGGGGGSSLGQYLSFPGPDSGYVEVPHDPALNPTDELTIDLWVYLNSYNGYGSDAGSQECPGFVGKGFETSYWLGIACDAMGLRFYGKDENNVDSTLTVPVDEWAHVAVTYDGTNVTFYVNGDADAPIAYAGPLGTNTEPVRIGNDAHWDQTPMGMIDDVRIWDVAASADEIATLMDWKIDQPTPGLVGAWNFEGVPGADVGGWGGALTGDAAIAGEPGPTPVIRLWADADCSDDTNPLDALAMLRNDAGLEVQQAVGCPEIGSEVSVLDEN